MHQELEIACKLSTEEFRTRLDDLRQTLPRHLIRVDNAGDRMTMSFPGNDEMVASLLEFIRFERQCCPFITFSLTVTPEPAHIELTLSGPPPVQAFIQQTFGSSPSIGTPSP